MAVEFHMVPDSHMAADFRAQAHCLTRPVFLPGAELLMAADLAATRSQVFIPARSAASIMEA